MGEITITYTDWKNSTRTVTYDSEATEIKIHLVYAFSIDLSPLASCQALQTLELSEMKNLRNLDLSPLASCQALQTLVLKYMENLQSLDLSPLAGCQALQTLAISGSILPGGLLHLLSLDLSPLASCQALQDLRLGYMRILLSLDLSPLASCQALQTLLLYRMEHLQSLDLSPLAACEGLQWLSIDLLTKLQSLDLSPLFSSVITNVDSCRGQSICSQKTVAQYYPKWEEKISTFDTPSIFSDIEVVRSILATLLRYEPGSWKIPHLLLQLRQQILPEIGLMEPASEEVQELVSAPESDLPSVLSTLYKDHIEGGGTTLFSDVERLAETELAILVDDILRLRREEIQEIRMSSNEDGVDLRPVYLTHYGFKVYTALELGLQCSEKEFQKVTEAIEELGGSIIVSDTVELSFPDSISPVLREYIYNLAEDPDLRRRLGLH